jgi:hypothetical protein
MRSAALRVLEVLLNARHGDTDCTASAVLRKLTPQLLGSSGRAGNGHQGAAAIAQLRAALSQFVVKQLRCAAAWW